MAIKKIAGILLRIGISIALLIFLFSRVDGKALWQLVKASDAAVLAAAALITGSIDVLCFIRWDLLLKASGVSAAWHTILKSFSGGLFFNIFLPTSIGGDVVRTLDLANHTRKGTQVASTVFLDRLSGYVALVVIVIVSCIMGWSYVQDASVLMSIGLITGVLLFILLALFNRGAYTFVNKLLYSPTAGRIRSAFTQVHEQLYLLGRQKKVLAVNLIISLAVQLLSCVSTYVVCRALGAQADLIYFFIFPPIIGIISMLPISIGGLGVRDAATVYFFAKAGLGRDVAFAMSLTGFFLTVLFAAAGGLYYVLTLHHRRV